MRSGGDPDALRADARKEIYDLIKSTNLLQGNLTALEETFVELSRLSGWSLDPELLKHCLNTRTAILRLRSVVMDDTEKAHRAITEHFLDIDAGTGLSRQTLRRLAGVE